MRNSRSSRSSRKNEEGRVAERCTEILRETLREFGGCEEEERQQAEKAGLAGLSCLEPVPPNTTTGGGSDRRLTLAFRGGQGASRWRGET